MSELQVHTKVVLVLAVGDGEVHHQLQVDHHGGGVRADGGILRASQRLRSGFLVLVEVQETRRADLGKAS